MQDLGAHEYLTLSSFVNAFLETKDPILSSQVSQMIGIYGPSLLPGFKICQPKCISGLFQLIATGKHNVFLLPVPMSAT